MMKVAIQFLLLLILLPVFSRQATEPIKTERINGVLCQNDSTWLPYTYPDAKPWTPTKEQVEATEQWLDQYLKEPPPERAHWDKADRKRLWEKLSNYKRQYFGFTRQGEEYIYCNLYCDKTPLSCNPVDVDDGGECYIRILFNASGKKVVIFHRNGKA